MITEDYCDFETSKLLKEKGFNKACWEYYDANKKLKSFRIMKCNYDNIPYKDAYIAPTLQIAMKWLRVVHNIHIIPEITDGTQLNPRYYAVIWVTTSGESHIIELFDSYEEACRESIKYCLENLI